MYLETWCFLREIVHSAEKERQKYKFDGRITRASRLAGYRAGYRKSEMQQERMKRRKSACKFPVVAVSQMSTERNGSGIQMWTSCLNEHISNGLSVRGRWPLVEKFPQISFSFNWTGRSEWFSCSFGCRHLGRAGGVGTVEKLFFRMSLFARSDSHTLAASLAFPFPSFNPMCELENCCYFSIITSEHLVKEHCRSQNLFSKYPISLSSSFVALTPVIRKPPMLKTLCSLTILTFWLPEKWKRRTCNYLRPFSGWVINVCQSGEDGICLWMTSPAPPHLISWRRQMVLAGRARGLIWGR